jgi:hypothetical protein
LPWTAAALEWWYYNGLFSVDMLGKWFLFFAGGIRLFVAGIRQIIYPGFTAKKIFQLRTDESFPVIRELGFANLCLGAMGLLSLSFEDWRAPAAFTIGAYYVLAGLMHLIRRSTGINEKFAMITDLLICVGMEIYFYQIVK